MKKLTVVDVGHGNAAVLEDKSGVTIVDTGRGTQLLDFLKNRGISKIEATVISHADTDHIGGAASLLHDPSISIGHIFTNADGSKDSRTWRVFRAAVALARAENRLRLTAGVHVGTQIRSRRAHVPVEILYPPPEALLGGTGSAAAPKTTSNSLSIALRVHLTKKHAILLGGDVEFECIDFWKREKMDVSSFALVFPHHGGTPGTASKAALFAYEFTQLVRPSHVAFSIHETLHTLPRPDVIAGILKSSARVRFMCTQLSALGKTAALAGDKAWRWHRNSKSKPVMTRCGHIVFRPRGAGIAIECLPS